LDVIPKYEGIGNNSHLVICLFNRIYFLYG